MIAILTGKGWNFDALIYIFLMNKDIEPFLCLLNIPISSFEFHLFISLDHLLKGLFGILIFSLYVLYIF